jgi:hypothetical protein
MNRSNRLLLIAISLTLPMCSHELKSSESPTVKDSNLTYCNSDQTFVVTGTGLTPMVINGATKNPGIDMPDVCMTKVADLDGNPVSDPNSKICLKESDVEWVSTRELRFTLSPDYGLSPGTWDVSITNPDGTKATGTTRIKVLPGEVLVFWSDPSIVYNGITTQATVYGTNLGDVNEVGIRNSKFEETKLQSAPEGTRQNRVQITIPSGTGPDTYDVVVHTSTGCIAELKRGLLVTATRDDKLVSSVDPTFGWTEQSTPVTVNGTGFQPVPRVYLNPHTPGGTTIATALWSVALKDPTAVTAVVPKSLPAGPYDVIVVNPDGRVGIIDKLPNAAAAEGGFFLSSKAPPVVANISPLYVDNQTAHTVTIDGSGFDNPTVTLSCRKPDGTTAALTGTVAAGGTATTFDASVPVGGLPGGTVCIVTVTNPDKSYYQFSAIGISLPSANLNPMVDAPSMATARRAPAVAAGRATRSARYLYAIGGDSGNAGGALRSVETSPIDVYGTPGAWFTQPVELPAKRTLAGAVRLGRFLYLVGGNDGMAPTTSVVRAEVLDPLAAPRIVDVGGARSKVSGEGIGPGIWYYRVAAVMADTDPNNAGGETLASDPIAVNLSAESLGDRKLNLTLYWDPVAGAKAYRIYRSPNGTENLDGVRLLTEIPDGNATSYEDKAPAGRPAGDPPRPLGATGNWMTMPALGTAREAAGITTAQDPADATKWYVYALGGRSPAPLATWERLAVTIDPVKGTQTVATWTAGAAPISAARSELTAFSVSHTEAIQVPVGTTFIYAGAGVGSTNVDAGKVAAGGELTWTSVKAMSPSRSGYAGVAGAGFLFAFGGSNTTGADDSMAAGQIDPAAVPTLTNWNNNGGARLKHPRYLAGSTVESAFIYLVGGSSMNAATATCERTVL